MLHVFARSTTARAFYERHGFEAVATGDGRADEEDPPDVTYRWSPFSGPR